MAIIQCRECGSDISSEAKSCPQCGCPCKEKKPIPKILIGICAGVVAVVVVIVALIFGSNAWKYTFDVEYKELNINGYLSPSYIYEITNKSDKTTQNVYAIIEVETAFKTFRFESYVGTIRQGETTQYRLSQTSIRTAAEEEGVDTELSYWLRNADIVGFKWE